MARVAMVESYPYEAVWGGDAVYLDRIREFLTGQGHCVDSYVTDVTRGRRNPFLRLRSKAENGNRWIVRNAVGRRDGQFLAYDPRLLSKILTSMPGRRAPPEHGVSAVEQQWLTGRLVGCKPDLVILAFGACAFAEALAALGVPVVALKGFFSDRRITLGDTGATQPSPDKAALDALLSATCVGFNNLQDLSYYRHATRAENGALIGMGFPSRRLATAQSAEPIILFVGARTTPNIASLEWFLDGAWAKVKDQVPDAQLRIVGAIGGAFAHLAGGGLRIAGFAESLEDEYRSAAVVIAPLTIGSSGVKTKVAEALSFGRPLVTTSLGVDPADPEQFGESVDVADDPADFAAAVVRLLQDPQLRMRRAGLAIRQFSRHFSEQAAYGALIDLLDGNHGSPPPSELQR